MSVEFGLGLMLGIAVMCVIWLIVNKFGDKMDVLDNERI